MARYMTKAEFTKSLKSDLIAMYGDDYPALRQAWNNNIDHYIKLGVIPPRAGDWTHPEWLYPPSQRKRRKRKARGSDVNIELSRLLSPYLGSRRKRRRSNPRRHALPKLKEFLVSWDDDGYDYEKRLTYGKSLKPKKAERAKGITATDKAFAYLESLDAYRGDSDWYAIGPGMNKWGHNFIRLVPTGFDEDLGKALWMTLAKVAKERGRQGIPAAMDKLWPDPDTGGKVLKEVLGIANPRLSKTQEDNLIREHLGHGIGGRRVRVTKKGEVHYYGSTDPYDRSHDYWHWGGWREEILRELRR